MNSKYIKDTYTIYLNDKYKVLELIVVTSKGLLVKSINMLKTVYDENDLIVVKGNKKLKEYDKVEFYEKYSNKIIRVDI